MSRIAGILMLVGILAFICGFDARYVIGLLALLILGVIGFAIEYWLQGRRIKRSLGRWHGGRWHDEKSTHPNTNEE